jgi:DNA-binding protein HU-beta
LDEAEAEVIFFRKLCFYIGQVPLDLWTFFSLSRQNILNLNIKTVTKAEIIAEIAEQTGIDKADVQTTVEAFFDVVKESMASGQNIYVRGFGSFVNKKRARKIARNISQNTAMVIDEHFVPSFKPSKVFIDKVKKSDKVKEFNDEMKLTEEVDG